MSIATWLSGWRQECHTARRSNLDVFVCHPPGLGTAPGLRVTSQTEGEKPHPGAVLGFTTRLWLGVVPSFEDVKEKPSLPLR